MRTGFLFLFGLFGASNGRRISVSSSRQEDIPRESQKALTELEKSSVQAGAPNLLKPLAMLLRTFDNPVVGWKATGLNLKPNINSPCSKHARAAAAMVVSGGGEDNPYKNYMHIPKVRKFLLDKAGKDPNLSANDPLMAVVAASKVEEKKRQYRKELDEAKAKLAGEAGEEDEEAANGGAGEEGEDVEEAPAEVEEASE
mmetsp:Transcript_93983/g.166353  ORF Transcript_93983/g.166353 Transcript_93983/m.166353 type:complete len:199 (+) Transcript_93983:75-671(+)